MGKIIYCIIISFILIFFFNSCEKDLYDTKEITCNNSLINSNHPNASYYQHLIDEYVAKGYPGISLYVKDGSGVWVGSSGFADIGRGIEFEPCHIANAGSITKTMVVALTMKLQEEGVLDIDDPVSKYIDSKILDKIEHPKGITLRNLMDHTTGIADITKSSEFYLDVFNNPNKEWETETLLKYIYGEESVKLTSEYPSDYSSTNTLLLVMCLNEATAKPHHVLLREKVLDPLGMNDTYYQGREKLPDNTAQSYFDLHNSGELFNVSNYITGSGNGFGGIFSNVFDLAKFLSALLIEKTFLTEASLSEMCEHFYLTRNDPEHIKVETGIGLLRKFSSMPYYGIGHAGKDLGSTADMFYFEDVGMCMIFFINYGTAATSHLKEYYFEFQEEIMLKMFDS